MSQEGASVTDTSGVQPVGQPQGLPQGQPTTSPVTQPTPGLNPAEVAAEVAKLMQSQPKEEPVEETPELTGMFNTELPEAFEGDVGIEGLFAIARHQFPELNLNRVLGKAWEEGDPSKVDLGYLAEVVGDDMARYYGEYFTGVISHHYEAMEEANNTWAQGVFEEFGGKPQWDRVIGTFNANADPGIISVVKGLLDSSNFEERNTGINMIRNFVQPLGVIPQQGRKLGSTAGAIPGAGAGGLSAKEFMEEVAKLSNSGRYDADAVEALRQRRALGAQSGL